MRALPALLLLLSACASPAPRPAAATAPKPTPQAVPQFPVGASPLVEPPQGEAAFLKDIRQLTLDGAPNAEPSFQADGPHLLFQSVRGGSAGARVFTVEVDGRNLRHISPENTFSRGAVFLPTQPAVLAALAQAQEPAPARLMVLPLDGSDPRVLLDNGMDNQQPAVSPDGAWVAFVGVRNGVPQVHVLEVATGNLRRLTQGSGPEGAPNFSANGQWVVFTASRDGAHGWDLYQARVDGQAEQRLTTLDAGVWDPVFHPGGSHIVFASNHLQSVHTPGTNVDLFMLGLRDGVLTRITTHNGHDTLPAFSRNGQQLAWTSTRQGGLSQIFVATWAHPDAVPESR